MEHTIRCCVRCQDPFGIPRLLVAPHFSSSRTGKLPVLPVAVVIEVLASVPAVRSVIAPYQNIGPVAGTLCRSSPRNRVTKSRTRRCQRSIVRPCWRNSSLDDPIRRTQLEYQNPPHSARRIFRKVQFYSKSAAIVERIIPDARHAVRYRHARQTAAIVERPLPILVTESGIVTAPVGDGEIAAEEPL